MRSSSADTEAAAVDERDLVERAKAGDQAAMAELYESCFPKVYRYVLARLGNSADAEDLTEEIFLKVLDAIGRFRWQSVPFSAWLFRIAHNEVVSHVRRQKSRGMVAPLTDILPDNRQDHVAEVETKLTLERVREATSKLPEAQRRVVELRFAGGLSVAETAAVLGKTEGNVKVLQHKGIAKLQRQFADEARENLR